MRVLLVGAALAGLMLSAHLASAQPVASSAPPAADSAQKSPDSKAQAAEAKRRAAAEKKQAAEARKKAKEEQARLAANDPDKLICKHVQSDDESHMGGSRLGGEKSCLTRAQWDDRAR
ncbi:MAG: hypothetical protein ACYC8V_08000, partial [Caulobacteraceae bacterium]